MDRYEQRIGYYPTFVTQKLTSSNRLYGDVKGDILVKYLLFTLGCFTKQILNIFPS